jgi:hypothetical protein
MALFAVTANLKAQTIALADGFESGDLATKGWTQENGLDPKAAPATAWAIESENLAYPGGVVQGTHRAYLRNTTGETQGYVTRLVSPVMRLDTVYRPLLRFYYANPKWTADRDTLRVLYRTGQNKKWNVLATYSDAKKDWEYIQLDLPEYNSTTYQIAFEGKDNLGRGIVLDSVVVRSTPECTVPRDFSVSTKGAGIVNLAWVASYDANQFEVVVLQQQIDPDTLASVPDSIITHHLFVDGLQQNVDLKLNSGDYYYAYVRSLCDAEESVWNSKDPNQKGAYYFRVKAYKKVPYTYGFDFPYEAGQTRRDLEWTWRTNTGKFVPFINVGVEEGKRSTYSPSATSCVVFEGNNVNEPTASSALPADKYAYVASPTLTDPDNPNFALNQCVVRFWTTVAGFTGRSYAHSLIVGVMDDPEDFTTFVPVDTVSVWGTSQFVENVVDLSSYQGNGFYLAFLSNFDTKNLIFLDDLKVEYKSELTKPSQITVNPGITSAQIAWKGNASSYNVLITNREVDPTKPAADFVVDQTTVNSNSYKTEALEADHSWNRPYYVYVQAVNGSEVSEWSYRYPFVTLAAAIDIPYTINFKQEKGTTYNIEEGSAVVYPVGIGIFSNDPEYPHLVTTNAHSVNSCLTLTKDWGNDSWITLPVVASALNLLQIKFYLSGSSTPTQASATVGIMTNPMDINTFIPVSECKVAATGYALCYANFQNYKGPEGVIAIVWSDVDGGKQTINYIDDITVEEIQSCLPPVNVQTDALSDSVTVSWDISTASMWDLVLSEKALTAKQLEESIDSIGRMENVLFAGTLNWDNPQTKPTFGFDSLVYNKSYYLNIRTICDQDTTWWISSSFTTTCPNDFPIPFYENFESYSTGAYEDGFNCWQVAEYGTDAGYPKILKPSSGAQDGNMLELWSTSTTHRNVAMLPGLDADLSQVVLSFDARSYGTTVKSVLYVGSMGDIRDWTTFVAIDTVYMDGGNVFTTRRYDLANYTLAYNNIVFTSGLGDNLEMNSDIYIDNISIKPNTCIEAWNFEATDIQTTSLDIKWDGKADNDEWIVKVMQGNKVLVADSTIIGKAFKANNLEAMTKYTFFVKPTCDTIWSEASFLTACIKLDPSKPNKETFEDYPSGTSYNASQQAPCWTVGNGNPSATTTYIPYIYKTSSTYAASGTNCYRLYPTATYSPTWVASPEIDCNSLTELLVTFSYYGSSSYYILPGVMTDPEDLSTFVVLDSIKCAGKIVTATMDLSEYADTIPAGAKYFAWRTAYNAGPTIYLDDVSIVKVNCPLPKPSYSGIKADQVRISSGLRADKEWILMVTNQELSEDSLAKEGYVVPDSIIVFNDTLDGEIKSKVVTGLNEQTDYYVAVATACDEGLSPWRLLSFKTPCKAVTPETLGTITFAKEDGYVTGSGATRHLPCWTTGNKSGKASATSSYIPYVTAGSATSAYSRNGLNYLYIYSYVPSSTTGTAYDGSYAIMPELDVDDISKYQVNFWARTSSTTTAAYRDELIVGVVTDPSDLNTFVVVDTVKLSHSAYEPFTVSIEGYQGDYLGNKGKYIMFLTETGATLGTLAYGYAYLSEISVEAIPTCRPVTEFTVDSIAEDAAIISWKQYSNSYRMLMSDKEIADDKKDTYDGWLLDSVVTKTDSVLITGLNPATQYYVYAQAICEGGDSSAISMAYANILTDCPLVNGYPVPYYNDFDNSPATGTGKKPLCWDGVQLTYDTVGTTQSHPYVNATASNAVSKYSLYMYSYFASSSNIKCIAVAPKVTGDLNEYMISFYARKGGTSASYGNKLLVGYVTDATQKGMDSTFVTIATVEVLTATQQPYQIIISDYVNNIPAGARIALKADWSIQGLTSTSGYGSFYIDNFKIGMPPSCFPPTLEPGNSTLYTADVTIIPAKDWNNKWQIAVVPDSIYSKAGYDAAEYLAGNDVRIVDADSANFTISGLDHSTLYWLYGRTVCGGEDGNSAWTDLAVSTRTKYYYKDSYFFGFEKEEGWERSQYSTSDNYIMHPAIETGYVQLGSAITSYSYMPYGMVSTTTNYNYGYGPGDWSLGKVGVRWNATASYYGQYMILPAVDSAANHSFEFKFRNGYTYPKGDSLVISTPSDISIEVGTVDKFKGMETYKKLATISMEKLPTDVALTAANDWLWRSYTLDLDSATIADKQIVFFQAEKPSASNYPYIDNVALGAPKGFGLVSIDKVMAEATSATVTWDNIGGPWNLYVLKANGDTLNRYENLSGVTSQLVEDLSPQSKYQVVLVAANAPEGTKYFVKDSKEFRTPCMPMEADANGEFFWNFDDPDETEPNDLLAGVASDTAYLKPSCFTTGTNYTGSFSNGYQWLWQSKGHDYYSTLGNPSDTYNHREIGYGDSYGSLRVYTTSTYVTKTATTWITLPQLNCDLDTMMIEFWGRCLANQDETATTTNAGKVLSVGYVGSGSLVIGTLTDPTDFSTLEVIDTVTYVLPAGTTTSTLVNSDPTGNRFWQKMQLPLAGTQGKYIVLFQPYSGKTALFFVDDLKVKPIGDNLFAPTGASTSNVTTNSATFNWTAKHPAIQTVVVVMDDAADTVKIDTVPGSVMSYKMENLKPSSSYTWSVYQTNGSVNTISTSALQFYTECVAVSPDYTNGFELADGWKILPAQTSDTYKQTLCWTYENAGTSAVGTYEYNYANGTSLYSHKGAYALRLYATSTTYQTYAAMPAIEDIAAYDTLQVNFWMRPTYVTASTMKPYSSYLGNTYSKAIIVGTMTDPMDATTFVPIDTLNYTYPDATNAVASEANDFLFQPKKVALTGAKGKYVAFMATLYAKGDEKKYTYDYMYIDDISFSAIQRCETPDDLSAEDISATNAKLSWNAPVGAEKYVLQVSTDYTYAADTAFVFNDTVFTNSQEIAGLESFTDYVWRVRTICESDLGESEFSQNAVFTTARKPFFVETFGATNLDADWTFATNSAVEVIDSTDVELSGANSTSYGWRRVTTNAGIEGAHYAVVFYSSSTTTPSTYDYYWMISPTISIGEKLPAHLSFDMALTGCSSTTTPSATQATEAQMADDYIFAIAISEDAGKTWKKENILAAWCNALPQGRQLRDIPFKPTNLDFDLTKYAGKNIKIAFYREANTYKGSSPYSCAIHLDNIRINYYEVIAEAAQACQYEDIEQLGFFINGDKAEAGEQTLRRIEPADYVNATTKGYLDSIYVLNVTYNAVPETIIEDTICEGETYSNYDFTGKTQTGIYSRKMSPANACDSIARLHLYVRPKEYSNIEDSICQGQKYNFHGKDYYTSGLYTDTIPSSHGCDSIVTLNLKVVTAFVSEFNAAICSGSSYYWEAVGKSYSEAGDYTETIKTAAGCDSTVTLHLSYNKNYDVATTVVICEGSSYDFGGTTLTKEGVYVHTFESAQGCDSTVTLTLEISNYYRDTTKVEIVEGETYTFYDVEYDQAGTYDIMRPGEGFDCDSLRVLVITVIPQPQDIDNVNMSELTLRPTILNAGETVRADYRFTRADLANLKVEVYDIVGRNVEAKKYEHQPIIIDAFPVPGVYTIRITTGTGLNLVGRVVVR